MWLVRRRDIILIQINSSTAEYSVPASGMCESEIVSGLSKDGKMSVD